MTAPMTAWMLYRGMPRRRVIEMSAVMPMLAIVLLLLGGIGVMARGDMALTEHGLMMPVMLIPMVLGSSSMPDAQERRSAPTRPGSPAGGELTGCDLNVTTMTVDIEIQALAAGA